MRVKEEYYGGALELEKRWGNWMLLATFSSSLALHWSILLFGYC
jgi:hypothetical protein